MRRFLKRRKALVVLTMVISMLIGIIPAQAASVWSFTAGSGKKITVNGTVTFEKNEYQDINLYKEGKEIKKNDKNYEVTWSSSDPDVVWVDKSNGKMRADKFNKMTADTATAKITATIKNKKTGKVAKRSFTIKVVGDNMSSISSQTSTNTPSPAAHMIYEGTTVELSKAKVGDVVLLGTYEQDNIESNGAEVIPWYVLDKDGDKLLLMSVYLLDCVKYHEKQKESTWEECTLRQWMNNEFYNCAFTESEKKHILTSYLKNEDNPSYKTEGGNDTEDKVFALSLEEVKQYFGIADDLWGSYWRSASPELSRAEATAYAEAQGAYVSTAGNGWWRLRSPGSFENDVAYIDGDLIALGSYDGVLYVGGNSVARSSDAVRPALWLNLYSGSETTTTSPMPTVTKVYGTLDLTGTGWGGYNVGSDANFSGPTLGNIRNGAKLEVLGESINLLGNKVYRVYSADLGKECYVAAKYVAINEGSQGVIPAGITDEELQYRMSELVEKLRIANARITGKGKTEWPYFTTTGTWLNVPAPDIDDKCNNKEVVRVLNNVCEDVFGSGISVDNFPAHINGIGGSDKQEGYSCFGFANFAQWYIYKNQNDDVMSSECVAVGTYNERFLKENLKPGDVIRVHLGYLGENAYHSMVVHSVRSNGIYVLHSNFYSDIEKKNMVTFDEVAFSKGNWQDEEVFVYRVVSEKD